MTVRSILRTVIPMPVRRAYRRIRPHFASKYDAEIAFWRGRLAADNGKFENAHYERVMLGMAQEPDDGFLKGKIVADFGCGPRGSLAWAKSAALRIGIDVLVDRYADAFKDDLISHGMVYVKSTEAVIPLPSNFVDVVITLNAIDHVDRFAEMCQEVLRILKPGGDFIASFNLEEPASRTEPQRLTEELVKVNLLDHLETLSYRVSKQGPRDNPYASFYEGTLSYQPGEEGFLWVRARKASQ
jgi:SAM-dependent methyltransferase